MSPGFWFVGVFVVVCLFVLGDSVAGWGFAAGAGGLTECCGPLRRLRVRLRPCKIDLNPPVALCY